MVQHNLDELFSSYACRLQDATGTRGEDVTDQAFYFFRYCARPSTNIWTEIITTSMPMSLSIAVRPLLPSSLAIPGEKRRMIVDAPQAQAVATTSSQRR